MTKTNEQKFEKQLEAEKLDGDNIQICWKCGAYQETAGRVGFERGARWGYQQGIRDVLEKLRSARNKDESYVGAAKAKDMRRTADWIEREMLGKK